ncbi:MAG: transglycosylase SLT domain-containing protein [Gammaproteobacteria bacterium]
MSPRLHALVRHCRALLAGGLALATLCVDAAPAADALAAERARFARVLAAQEAGRHAEAATLVRGLEHYPLYPYFVHADLRRRLHHFPRAEITRFLEDYAGSLLAARLRGQLLEQLAHARRWEAFLAFYQPQDDLTLRCHQLVARVETGRPDGLLEDIRAVWLNGASLPDACDPAFARLYASPLLDDELVWARVHLAIDAGNFKLARYLARRLTSARLKNLHALWETARYEPRRLLARDDLADDASSREILLYALARLARGDLAAGESAWQRIAGRYAFDDADRGAAARALALAAAASDHPRRIALLDAVPAASVDDAIERYRMREGILARAWPELVRWTAQAPTGEVNPLRWRYWRARALAATGQDAAARTTLAALAGERDYFGFLAADLLGRPYDFGHRPVAASAAELAALKARPGIARARELFLLDRRYPARREWFFEIERMDRRSLEVAASVAADWGWRNQAIFALGRARSWDDLELRFPVDHAALADKYAVQRRLDPARVMAVIRSESAFVIDARSPAGALGLMQLMPATAREMAQRTGIRLTRLEALYEPDVNIALGTAYLERMLARYGGNFAMAAAAYNAGPLRVRQWQNSSCTSADIWIDTIPFTETRRYVRRALFYAAVYEWRLGREITPLTRVMPAIPAAGTHDISDCTP